MAEHLTGDEIPNDLRQLLIQYYGIGPKASSSIFKGDEAQVWKVDGGGRDIVVHIGPAWRRSDELAWVHKVILCAATVVPQSVGPIATRSGASFVEWEGALVAVYPFVEGASLDRIDEAEVSEAGRVLGILHAQLLNFDGGERPGPRAL